MFHFTFWNLSHFWHVFWNYVIWTEHVSTPKIYGGIFYSTILIMFEKIVLETGLPNQWSNAALMYPVNSNITYYNWFINVAFVVWSCLCKYYCLWCVLVCTLGFNAGGHSSFKVFLFVGIMFSAVTWEEYQTVYALLSCNKRWSVCVIFWRFPHLSFSTFSEIYIDLSLSNMSPWDKTAWSHSNISCKVMLQWIFSWLQCKICSRLSIYWFSTHLVKLSNCDCDEAFIHEMFMQQPWGSL